jgi:hypothetical protein
MIKFKKLKSFIKFKISPIKYYFKKQKKIEIFLKDSAVKPKKLNISDTFQKQIKKQLRIVLLSTRVC